MLKNRSLLAFAALAVGTVCNAQAKPTTPITGDYLEVRTCDVYTGPCFANGEMNLAGKEGILVWSINQGSWDGVALDGLKVIVVVRTDETLGNLRFQPRDGKAVLILDEKANSQQQAALTQFARTMAGRLAQEVVTVKSAPIDAKLGTCTHSGCAQVKAGNLVEVSTRCLGANDHVCGNEDAFYPPLTSVETASPAYTELAAFKGDNLGLTWEATGQRSAFVAEFAL
jgi:hypothetical protein